VEVSGIFCDIVEDVSWTLVDVEGGCFEVDGIPEVVVAGQLVWVDEDVGWERVENMERARRREWEERETRVQGRMETR
jgi:hypothetical protein